MAKLKNLLGQKFGKLTVIKKYGKDDKRYIVWQCKCDCGNEKIVRSSSLLNGNTTSCGCLKKENIIKAIKKYNSYDLTGEYGIGYTSEGEEFYFDLEDYDKIKDYCWVNDKNGYLRTHEYGSKKTFSMHRLIFNIIDTNLKIDHINHHVKDNRKENLRICTSSQNQMNQLERKDNTSGIKGVSWDKKRNKWIGYLTINGERFYEFFDDKNKAISYRKILEEKYFKGYKPTSSQFNVALEDDSSIRTASQFSSKLKDSINY